MIWRFFFTYRFLSLLSPIKQDVFVCVIISHIPNYSAFLKFFKTLFYHFLLINFTFDFPYHKLKKGFTRQIILITRTKTITHTVPTNFKFHTPKWSRIVSSKTDLERCKVFHNIFHGSFKVLGPYSSTCITSIACEVSTSCFSLNRAIYSITVTSVSLRLL